MLYEIYCEQFHQKKIIFNEGLSVVLGTDCGHNSIGKSTFLLIVDFVFGGNTYSGAKDIIKNIGNHDIYFAFKFDNVLYKFCRNNTKPKEIWECDDNYYKIKSCDVKDFCKWLDEMYKMQLPDLTFRDAIGRYTRVYGKENCDEKRPLHSFPKEKSEQATYALLKLFNEYLPIKDAQIQTDTISKKHKTYSDAQKFNLITKITRSEYNQNLKRIELIKKEICKISKVIENQMIGNDPSVSEEALYYKNLLSSARRSQGSLKAKYNVISNNQDYKFSLTTNTYTELSKYFPNIELKNIEKVEIFHNKIARIFKEELIEEKDKLQKAIQEYDTKIKSYEDILRKLLNNEDIPKKVLQQHANLLRELDMLQKQNYAYFQGTELKESKKESLDLLSNLKTKQFSIVQNKINTKMASLNDYIYDGIYNSPLLYFTNNGYNFQTPDDTGTGIACKGLIIMDLAILSLTKLPIIVHDSLILKQIYDNAIEKILELYIQVNKQVIIAFDKQNSYTSKTQKLLNENAILRLAPGGKELFGKSWG